MSLSWDRLEDRVTVGPELIQEMEEQVIQIRQRLKEAQDRQKIMRMHTGLTEAMKWETRFSFVSGLTRVPYGSGRGQSCIGPIAYHLILPPHLHKTHNVFHVFVLRHYVVDESHKLNWKEL
jgi:hypothetical protein